MNKLTKGSDELSQVKRALFALETMREKVETLERAKTEPIAIIGMACRFPGGANDPEAFWRLLHEGCDAITEVPAERWDIDAFYDPDPDAPGKMYTRWGGFLENIDQFDPAFFGISPREAVTMDPQQRLLLELCWEALERSGYAPDSLTGSRTGIFIGITSTDYAMVGKTDYDPAQVDVYSGMGSGLNVASGRLSYLLGLQGPNFPVDTACSSSLVATQLACESLRSGGSSMALVGGVNLILSPTGTIFFSKMRAMAADGRCKTFDAHADGYVRGEGCGVIVLKRLSDAQAAGDPILALIRGAAVNHNGRSNGLTAPSGRAQEAVIRQALSMARIKPNQISYVEAHGTGTSLGDPIEIQALGAVLGEERTADTPFLVGSVKTNMGHLEAAAGIAGLIKVVLALQHEEIPSHLHLSERNPAILWSDIPIRVPTTRTPWIAQSGKPRYAGVSSFGFSGTNAHVILEEAPLSQRAGERADLPSIIGAIGPSLVPISGRSPSALLSALENYEAWFRAHPTLSAYKIAAATSLHRSHFEYRATLLGESTQELAEQAAQLRGSDILQYQVRSVRRKLAFVCSGQGGQWPGMGRRLLETEPVFREQMERCEQALRPYVDWSLLHLFQAGTDWNEIAIIQPALFALHLSLAALWKSWGVIPDAIVGHSMGEIGAACLAGILSLEDGAYLISRRSQLLSRIRGKGAMLFVEVGQEQAVQMIQGYEASISIAVSNSPKSTVLAGEPAMLEILSRHLTETEVYWRWIKVDVASHSPQVEELRDDLLRQAQQIRPGMEQIAFYSTVEGQRVKGTTLDAAYWVRNLREPVRFTSTIQQMLTEGYTMFLELSPHPLLTASIQETADWRKQQGLAINERECVVISSMYRDEDERKLLLQALGTIYTHGGPVDWSRVYPEKPAYIPLPTYPFQRDRYWVDTSAKRSTAGRLYTRGSSNETRNMHPTLGAPLELARTPGVVVWEGELTLKAMPYLYAHRLQNVAVLPVAAYCQLALEAAIVALVSPIQQKSSSHFIHLSKTQLHKALFVPDTTMPLIQLEFQCHDPHRATWHIYSRMGERWILHASGQIAMEPGSVDSYMLENTSNNVPSFQYRLSTGESTQDVSSETYYETLQRWGIQYDAPFHNLTRLFYGDRNVSGAVQLSHAAGSQASCFTQAMCIDASLQMALAAMMGTPVADDERTAAASSTMTTETQEQLVPQRTEPEEDIAILMPVEIASVRVSRQRDHTLWGQASMEDPPTSISAGSAPASTLPPLCQARLFNEPGQVVVELKGLRFATLGRDAAPAQSDQVGNLLYEVAWEKITALLPRQAKGSPADASQAAAGETRGGGQVNTDETPVSQQQGSWLIFADTGGIGSTLADLLRSQGKQCILVVAGVSYAHPEADTYVVDPTRSEQLQHFFEVVFGDRQLVCCGIVHLWSIVQQERPLSIEAGIQGLHDMQVRGCGSVIAFLQALNKYTPEAEAQPRIWLITSGVHSVNGGVQMEDSGLLQAPIWGLGRVLAEEHRELWGGLVDLDPTTSATASAEALFSLLYGSDVNEDQIVLRDGYCYGARLMRAQPSQPPIQFLPWHVDGAYVLTGGLGALGCQVADWMVEQGARRLVMLNRTPLPPRSQWNKLPIDSQHTARIAAIKALEAKGATVEVEAVDVADPRQLQAFLQQYIAEDKPPIRGVMHLAGAVEDRLLTQLDQQALDTVWSPKVIGGWLLHTLLRDTALDFFVVFSSMSSLMGSPGQGSYAAANAFLDGLIHYRRAHRLVGLSMNWSAWNGLGFAVTAGAQRVFRRLQNRGFKLLELQQALEALEVGMRRDAVQMVVANVDWQTFLGLSSFEQPPAFLRRISAELQSQASVKQAMQVDARQLRQELEAMAPQQRSEQLEGKIREILGRVLRMDASHIDSQQPLSTLGLDSIMGIEMKVSLEGLLGLTLSTTIIWNYPTVSALATYLSGKLGTALETVSLPGIAASASIKDRHALNKTLESMEQLSEDEALQALMQKD